MSRSSIPTLVLVLDRYQRDGIGTIVSVSLLYVQYVAPLSLKSGHICAKHCLSHILHAHFASPPPLLCCVSHVTQQQS